MGPVGRSHGVAACDAPDTRLLGAIGSRRPVRRTPCRYGGETVTIRNNDHRPGTGTAELVAQVVNGLPTSKRPAGTNSLTRLGTATPVCDRQDDLCPCCWPKSRGRTPCRYGGETVTIRNNGHRPGTGTAEVVAQVVNGLPTSKRPAGTNSLTRLGTATPVCDRQDDLCPCCWPKSRGGGVRRTGHKVIGYYRQPAPGASHAMPVRWGDGDNP
jgi:hypothetical protein